MVSSLVFQLYCGDYGWNFVHCACTCRKNSLTAHVISRAKGANFVMYLADMKANGSAIVPGPGIERYMTSSLLVSQQTHATLQYPFQCDLQNSKANASPLCNGARLQEYAQAAELQMH